MAIPFELLDLGLRLVAALDFLAWIVLLCFCKALCLVSKSTFNNEMSSFLFTALYRSFMAVKNSSIFLQTSTSSVLTAFISAACLFWVNACWIEVSGALAVRVFFWRLT